MRSKCGGLGGDRDDTAQVVVIFSNMAIPAWTSAAAIVKLGREKAAMAEAATLGYESVM